MRVRAGWVAVCPVGQPEEPGSWLGAAALPSWACAEQERESSGALPLSTSALTELPAGPALG